MSELILKNRKSLLDVVTTLMMSARQKTSWEDFDEIALKIIEVVEKTQLRTLNTEELKQFKEFERVMREEVIPKIEDTIYKRQVAAVKIRNRIIK